MPVALVLWSPWTDVTGIGDTYSTLKNADPFVSYDSMLQNMADAYANPSDQNNPYVSPVYGNFSKGFPPTLIQGGTKELLLSDFVRLYQARIKPASLSNWTFMKACHMYFKQSFTTLQNLI